METEVNQKRQDRCGLRGFCNEGDMTNFILPEKTRNKLSDHCYGEEKKIIHTQNCPFLEQ